MAAETFTVGDWLRWLEDRPHNQPPSVLGLRDCARAIRAAAPDVLDRPATVPPKEA